MKLNVIANLNDILQLFDSSYHTSALSSTSTKSPFKSPLLHYSHFQTIVHLSKFFYFILLTDFLQLSYVFK